MKDLEYLLKKMKQRKAALKELIERDYTGNLTALNEQHREVKYWIEFIERELEVGEMK
jgi:hypothetical protein